MRVNVYSEELGAGVKIYWHLARDGEQFLALRIYQHTPQPLLDHMAQNPDDDDRSAVTYFFRDRAELRTKLLDDLDVALENIPARPPRL